MTIAALVLMAAGLGGPQAPIPDAVPPAPRRAITGDVVDTARQALPGVVVAIRDTPQLAVTDDHGRFSIVPSADTGSLVFSLPGFESAEILLTTATAAAPLHITLTLAKHTEQVTVRAPVIGTPPDDRYLLRPLDVVRTAGAQADVMRALLVLPGVSQVDEGAGLFVRGGDVSETKVLLDGTVINHPYRYETPTGGFRGAVDPFLTQGVTFTTGGFSAEYGDALSGIVDLHGLAKPTAAHQSFTAGLAGVSGQASQPIGTRGGVRFAANRATPGVLFGVNPSPQPFDQLPGGWDIAGGAYLNTQTHGSLHVFAIDQRDHVGVQLEQDSFVGFLHSSTAHHIVSAAYLLPLSATWDLAIEGGTDNFVNGTDVGVLDIHETDREHSARVDVGGRAGDWTLRVGADGGATRTMATGDVPSHGGDFGGVSGTRLFDVSHGDWTAGTYAEVTRAFGRIAPTVGVREQYFATSGALRFDPRVNVGVDFGTRGRMRLAWGIYHQAPSPAYFDDVDGALSLGPLQATHYVAGYELGAFEGAFYFRAEVYAKTYRDLPVQDDVLGFAGNGYGSAHGVDVFTRRVWHYMDIRASASWLDAERRWTAPSQQDRYPLPAGTWTPDFDVPYALQIAATVPVAPSAAVATAWRTAAGKPFTPAVGATLTPNGFAPIWAPINSERLPRYERFDLAFTYTHLFAHKTNAIFFFSIDNVLNRQNFFSYAYSADYSTRRPVPGGSPRSFYIGCSILH